jgi:hypothetical protein
MGSPDWISNFSAYRVFKIILELTQNKVFFGKIAPSQTVDLALGRTADHTWARGFSNVPGLCPFVGQAHKRAPGRP